MADFSAAALAAAVHSTLEETMATIPPGKRGALLAQVVETANGPQASAVVAAHIGGIWQVAGGGSYDRTSGLAAKFGLMGAW